MFGSLNCSLGVLSREVYIEKEYVSERNFVWIYTYRERVSECVCKRERKRSSFCSFNNSIETLS